MGRASFVSLERNAADVVCLKLDGLVRMPIGQSKTDLDERSAIGTWVEYK